MPEYRILLLNGTRSHYMFVRQVTDSGAPTTPATSWMRGKARPKKSACSYARLCDSVWVYLEEDVVEKHKDRQEGGLMPVMLVTD